MDLLPSTVYTTKLIALHIYGTMDAAALKRAERWVAEQSLNFDCLNAKNICDEHDRPAKEQVMAQINNRHKAQRSVLLFVKIDSNSRGPLSCYQS